MDAHLLDLPLRAALQHYPLPNPALVKDEVFAQALADLDVWMETWHAFQDFCVNEHPAQPRLPMPQAPYYGAESCVLYPNAGKR